VALILGTVGLGAAIWVFLAEPGVTLDVGGERYELLAPHMLMAFAVAPFLIWVVFQSLADLPPLQRALGVTLRIALLAVLTLALARLARTTEETKVSAVYLVDVSESVPDTAIADAQQIVERAWDARGDNDVRLVTFARDARAIPIARDAEDVPAITRHREPGAGAGSDLQAAMQLTYGLFPAGHLRRAVLISDGIQTEGDLLAEASRAARFDVRLFYHPYRRGVPHEVAVREVSTPERIDVGEPFHVRARVLATAPTKARVRLYQDETINGLDGVREVELAAGENDLEFRSVVHVAGPVTYRLEVDPAGPDRFPANNRYAVSTVVPGRPTVLFVEPNAAAASHLARALGAGELDVDVRSPRALPQTLRELERYDFVILSDVPAEQVSLGQMDVLERYVRDLGGGFLMAGGESSFGLGGWQGTRMERFLPVRMDAERRRDQPSLALALVIDKSGSMSGQKMELAKEAARATAEVLSADDYIGVIGFDSQPTRIVRMQSARNRIGILRDIGRLSAQGGTQIFPALDMAYQDLAVTRARIKHVILLTDGITQERQVITDLVQVMRAESITVSIVGLGADVNRGLLTQIAALGGGRAYFTNDPHNLPRLFLRETMTVSRSAAVEEYFQPRIVQRADFLRGIDLGTAPYLHGYVATRAKPEPAQVILESELAEPILARWRVGLGWSMAWTSDVKNRWSIEWLRWPGFSRFWAQLVREHMRQRRRQTLDMRAEMQGDTAHVVVDAIGGDDRFLDGLESALTLDGPMGAPRAREGAAPDPSARRSEEHRLRQTAPGRYEAWLPLERYGAFVLTAVHRQEGRAIAESTARLANPYPLEYATRDADEDLMRRAATLTGGSAEPTPAAVMATRGEKIRHHEDLWPKLLFVALALFLADLLLRRVRLFDRKFRAPATKRGARAPRPRSE
jgi:uncharacterized membrane protein